MQVAAICYLPDATRPRQEPDASAQWNAEILVPPPENKARAQVNTDVIAIGNGAGSEDIRAVQADWQRMQASKAETAAKADEEKQAVSEQHSSMANDLAMIALAAQSGNATAVLAAQQRLAQHVLNL